MSEFIMLFVFLLIAFAACIIIFLYTYKLPLKITGGIVNYDSGMRKYVYKINMSRVQILNRIKQHNAGDIFDYVLDIDNEIIYLKKDGVSSQYSYSIREYDNFCILQINNLSNILYKTHSAYPINQFWSKKLDAEFLPFSQYGIN